MSNEQIYLDHNGTTPVAPEVAEAMWPFLTGRFGNPSSATAQGRLARDAVETAREQLSALIGAHRDEITFTSGGTEANNLAILGVARLATQRTAVSSVVEHPATAQPLEQLAQGGWVIQHLPVDREGRIDADAIHSGPVGLGTFILAQNEVGTLQPIAALAEKVHSAGGVVHADAAQAVGKVPVVVDELGVDLLSIAGHKFYAPKGVGALYVRRSTRIAPVLVGAGQERGLRPGTENVAGIVGLGAAAELAARSLAEEAERQHALRELLWSVLSAAIPDLVRISPSDGCLPNTLMVATPNRIGSELLERAAEVGASTGSACHSGVHTPSTTLIAMGVHPDLALGALRFSIGRATRDSDVRSAAADLAAAANS